MKNYSPIQTLLHPLFKQHNIEVVIKRDDLLHPVISGNKWRKLKYNLITAQQQNKQGVLSFGGSYSNHIHALAFACQQQNLASIGIIRGEQQYQDNFTLSWVKHWGMALKFVDRKTYKLRHQAEYLAVLAQQYPDYFIVPEGGSNALALPGVGEVIQELNQQIEFDTLITPVGSGGTLAGLIAKDKAQHQLLGIGVLKQCDYLRADIQNLLPSYAQAYKNWQLLTDFHRGGYAKFSDKDSQRIVDFSLHTGIDFEPVYSGKMVLALLDLIEQGFFSAKKRIVLLHTGGLQGLGGMAERGLITAKQWHLPPVLPAQ